MRRLFMLAPVAALLAPLLIAASPPKGYEWSRSSNPARQNYSYDGMTVALAARDEDGLVTPVFTVKMKGYPPLTVEGVIAGPVMPHQVLFGYWNKADTMPSVVLQGFSGGAHCCAEAVLVRPVAGKWVRTELGSWDGEGLTGFPTDIDGDGEADIVRRDDRFLYVFASYAGSWAPPRIFNVANGATVDVSARPGFRPLFVKDAAEARKGCLNPEYETNGACAGWLASAARAGTFDAAWKEALPRLDAKGQMPYACTVKLQGECPDAKRMKWKSMGAAMRWFLTDLGYLSPAAR